MGCFKTYTWTPKETLPHRWGPWAFLKKAVFWTLNHKRKAHLAQLWLSLPAPADEIHTDCTKLAKGLTWLENDSWFRLQSFTRHRPFLCSSVLPCLESTLCWLNSCLQMIVHMLWKPKNLQKLGGYLSVFCGHVRYRAENLKHTYKPP